MYVTDSQPDVAIQVGLHAEAMTPGESIVAIL